jgi:crotonobetainyl-CoA:carnitine CoA-transferase CaiB-like acyl-CoA transferase
VLAGPYTASILAELGADVVKVEAPGGDPARSIGPFVDGRSLYFASVNSDKRGVVLDLQRDDERADLDALLATTDIVVENFLPAVGERLQVAPDQLLARHPALIVVSVSGYARGSVEERRPVLDLVVQAESGIMSVTGEPGRKPVRAGVPIGDLAAGLWGAVAALGGLAARNRDGRGRHFEVPLLDAALSMLSYMATASLSTGEDPPRVGSGHHSVVPYGAYPTVDGWVVIAVIGDRFFGRLCAALCLDGLDADPELETNAGRTLHRSRIDEAIALATAKLSTSALVEILSEHDVPHAPVNGLTRALAAPYVEERRLVESRHGDPPYRVVRGPIAAENRTRRPAPELGEHTEEILDEVGRPRHPSA